VDVDRFVGKVRGGDAKRAPGTAPYHRSASRARLLHPPGRVTVSAYCQTGTCPIVAERFRRAWAGGQTRRR
jgi:hypothetical protein